MPNVFPATVLIMLVGVDLMAGIRAPVSRILPLRFGVMVFGGIMKVHIHEGGSLQGEGGDAIGLRLVDPDMAILIVVSPVVLVVIDAVVGIINVVVGDHGGGHGHGRGEVNGDVLGGGVSGGFGQEGQEDCPQEEAALPGFRKKFWFNHAGTLLLVGGQRDGV